MTGINLSFDDDVAILTLSTPLNNRFGVELMDGMDDAIDKLSAKKARAVLLCAEGPDFSHGGDVRPWGKLESHEINAIFERYMDGFNRLERLPIPVIAAVQGLCNGGGLELVLRADILFASESARFSHSEQTVGFVTVLGGIYRVAERAGRLLAYQWALTSEQIPASEFAKHGLVNYIVPDASLKKDALNFAKRVAKGPTLAHGTHKALLRVWSVGGIAAADDVMFDLARPLLDSKDFIRGKISASEALAAGKPRPTLDFQGR
ncbi:enoyl-CoA hydratase/isomerase family protein [Bradyrhizobium erythrophlei]|uniref:Enoyl-CoA hydratase/carnithine racemase n=1 Tax=Bradyrhizobium erythrophlei TaxID=1437360 RepID=A0A1H4WRP1_9BRAD|nr:enoyl-CoA hydratase/isomerase family protein [Bradyrhizobium erythrophlei]SEC96003.1 Enoyl-CoA hydratase/carnithine racemase [Bradyrhizobium erythrophlei]